MSKKKRKFKTGSNLLIYLLTGVVLLSIFATTALLGQRQTLNSSASSEKVFAPRPQAVSFTACELTGASWVVPGGTDSIGLGEPATLQVKGAGDCDGETVVFNVQQDQGIFGTRAVKINPDPAVFKGGVAIGQWVAEDNGGMIGGLSGAPVYFFTASVSGGDSIISADPKLQVK